MPTKNSFRRSSHMRPLRTDHDMLGRSQSLRDPAAGDLIPAMLDGHVVPSCVEGLGERSTGENESKERRPATHDCMRCRSLWCGRSTPDD
jgi:hypothetical protein